MRMATSTQRFAILDCAYWSAAAILAGAVAHPLAARFDPPSLSVRLLTAAVYLTMAAALAWGYRSMCSSATWRKVTLGALLMPITAAVVYSVTRQELVLLVYPSLFCLPGAVFGAALASARFQSRRSSQEVETQL